MSDTDQPAPDVVATTPPADSTIESPAADSTFGVERHGMFGVSGSGDTTGFGGLVREPWVAPTAERPYGSYFDEIVDALYEAYPQAGQAVLKVVVDRDELTLHVAREHLIGIATVLRNDPNLRFELCSSVSGVDYLGSVNRLHSVVHLTSLTYRRRVRLEVAVSVEDPHVPSLTALYPGADWQERETFDMFGIVYDGHPALTRILMPDDWDGHPQRKDYPLGGIPVQYKGATIPPPDERRAYK
ncbi:MAG: NADH-quinone oxidoreductase subunit C [Actinobacteria bacterium]|nr:NADH-quinone oxidoreductase subunit C [Actinomycetota bacterium]